MQAASLSITTDTITAICPWMNATETALTHDALVALGIDPNVHPTPESAIQWGRACTFAVDENSELASFANLEVALWSYLYLTKGYRFVRLQPSTHLFEIVGESLATVGLLRTAFVPAQRRARRGPLIWSNAPERASTGPEIVTFDDVVRWDGTAFEIAKAVRAA